MSFAQTARLLADAERRISEALWDMDVYEDGEETFADVVASLQPVSAPVDVTDAEAFPEIARAIAGLAALSPERRAELEREWDA